MTSQTLKDQSVVVTGGTRGLGRGIVEALVAQGAKVTVMARDEESLAETARTFGVRTVRGDITDPDLAGRVLREVRPSVVVLNAGAVPPLGTIDEIAWEDFSHTWEVDVKGAFHWVQAALRLPLGPGSRVLLGSSGAAVNGSPLSGGYAGAKRMIWLMAAYANDAARARGLALRFQVVVPQRIIGETDLGRAAATGYAARKGVSVEAFLAGFGAPLLPAKVGEHVVSILTEDRYAAGVAFGLKGETGIVSLDA